MTKCFINQLNNDYEYPLIVIINPLKYFEHEEYFPQ